MVSDPRPNGFFTTSHQNANPHKEKIEIKLMELLYSVLFESNLSHIIEFQIAVDRKEEKNRV